jgi:predicted RNase H-like HicB family nuclease
MNKRNPELWTKAQHLAGRGYTTTISEDTLSDGTKVYLTEHPELEGCMTQGDSVDQALNDLKQVTVDFIYYLLEDGLEVPNPISSQTITGGSGSKAKLVDLGPIVTFTPKDEELSRAEVEEIFDEIVQPEHRKTIMQFSVVEGKFA